MIQAGEQSKNGTLEWLPDVLATIVCCLEIVCLPNNSGELGNV